MGSFTSANLGEADVMVYLCHDPFSVGFQGIAGISSACNDQSSGRFSINEYQESKAYFGGVSSLLLSIFVSFMLRPIHLPLMGRPFIKCVMKSKKFYVEHI